MFMDSQVVTVLNVQVIVALIMLDIDILPGGKEIALLSPTLEITTYKLLKQAQRCVTVRGR